MRTVPVTHFEIDNKLRRQLAAQKARVDGLQRLRVVQGVVRGARGHGRRGGSLLQRGARASAGVRQRVAGRYGCSAFTGVTSVPMRSMLPCMTSPAFRKVPLDEPTPAGVPVEIRSPGS